MQPSFLRGMRQDIHKKEYKKRNRINSFFKRAGDGNRTHVSSLEGWCSTIELHPQRNMRGLECQSGFLRLSVFQCPEPESNQRHEDFQSSALPTELSGHIDLKIRINSKFPNSTGRRWIRTTEASCSRFTVCPLWPLGNPPISF